MLGGGVARTGGGGIRPLVDMKLENEGTRTKYLMSISLKVVSMAAVFCESLRRWAVRLRIGRILT